MPESDISREHLKEITTQMVEAITSPAYVEAMRAVKSAPEGKRLEEAMRRLTPEALRAQGVPLPQGMRISSRYFEKGFTPIEVGVPSEKRNLLADLHAVEPQIITLLDGIRTRSPDLFDELKRRLAPDEFAAPAAACGCACGGAATVCGGAGGG